MMEYKHYSITPQIVSAFGILTGILVLFVFMVFYAFEKNENQIRILTSHAVPNLAYIGAIREGVGLIQISLLRHMLESDNVEKKSYHQVILNSSRNNAELFRQKNRLLISDEGKRLFNEAIRKDAEYAELVTQVLELSYANRDSDARDFNDSRVRPAYDAYQKVLDELSGYIKAQTEERTIEAVALIASMKKAGRGFVLPGVAVAFGMGFFIIWIVKKLKQNNLLLQNEIEQKKKAEREKERLIDELKEALNNIKQLRGLLPICASCKKIRDDKGYWQQLESFISQHSEAQFTHGICPECTRKLYPELYKKNLDGKII